MLLRIVTMRVLALLFILILIFSIFSCRYSRQAVNPNVGVHDQIFENSWVIDLDATKKLVQLQIVETKMDILFQTEDEFVQFLSDKINTLVPVTFYCNGQPSKDCDLKKPFDLYVATRKVKPVMVQKKAAN